MGKIKESKSERYISDGAPPKLEIERFSARPETKALARWLAVTRGIELHELYESLLIAEDERSAKY